MAEVFPEKREDSQLLNQGASIPTPPRRNGRLTREGMLHVIRNGGSFHWTVKHEDGSDGLKVITREQDVPNEADIALASKDTNEADRVRKENEAEIERLKADNAALRKAGTPAIPAAIPAK